MLFALGAGHGFPGLVNLGRLRSVISMDTVDPPRSRVRKWTSARRTKLSLKIRRL